MIGFVGSCLFCLVWWFVFAWFVCLFGCVWLQRCCLYLLFVLVLFGFVLLAIWFVMIVCLGNCFLLLVSTCSFVFCFVCLVWFIVWLVVAWVVDYVADLICVGRCLFDFVAFVLLGRCWMLVYCWYCLHGFGCLVAVVTLFRFIIVRWLLFCFVCWVSTLLIICVLGLALIC